MTRQKRIYRAASFYHIILRGNNSQDIFFSDVDRCRLSFLLQEGSERFGYRIHGYCFMSNHIHLVFQAGNIHISRAMQNLSFRYTQYINCKYDRVGHLFQGRFKAILIDDAEYLLELIRYVHLNPVRAGIVKKPEDYKWSGHRVFLKLEELLWLTQNWVLSRFDTHEDLARKRYEEFVLRGINGAIATNFKRASHEGNLLGSDDFARKILHENEKSNKNEASYTLKQLIETVSNHLKIPVANSNPSYKKKDLIKAQAMVAFFIKQSTYFTLKEFSIETNKDLSWISKLAQKIEKQLLTNKYLSKDLESIRQELEKQKGNLASLTLK